MGRRGPPGLTQLRTDSKRAASGLFCAQRAAGRVQTHAARSTAPMCHEDGPRLPSARFLWGRKVERGFKLSTYLVTG